MRELRGYKLVNAECLEAFIQDVFPDLGEYRRMRLQEFWINPQPHEKKFHAQSAYLDGLEKEALTPEERSIHTRYRELTNGKRRAYIADKRAETLERFTPRATG